MGPENYIYQNPELELHWAGWVSTARRLQSAGWNISIRDRAHPKFMEQTVEIAIRHSSGEVYGIANPVEVDFMRYAHQYQMKPPPIQMRMTMGRTIQIAHMGPAAFEGFEPYDALTPPHVSIVREVQDIRNLRLFRTLPQDTPVVTLEQMDIDEILQLALKKQAPIKRQYERYRYERDLLTPATKPAGIIQLAV